MPDARPWIAAGLISLATVGLGCKRSPASSQPIVINPGPSMERSAEDAPSVAQRQALIACGKTSCDSNRQVCCGFGGDTFGCAPRVSPAPTGETEARLRPLLDSCEDTVKSEYSFDHLALCDDSSDCGEGKVCCVQWLWSGASLLECIPEQERGELPCDYHERCVGDSCRTRGTHCVDSECKLEGARVRCNGVVCEGPTPVCCLRELGGTPRCEADCKATDAEDSRAFRYDCSSSAQCPSGGLCQAGLVGSYCSRSLDTANAVMLCEAQSDCPPDLCTMLGGSATNVTPKCKQEHVTGMTSCSCD